MIEKNFVWKDEYSVNVALIDEQHKHFVGLLNQTYCLIDSDITHEKLMELLENIVEYAHTHFATEEKYFDEFNFEGSDEHKSEHIRLLDTVHTFVEKRENSHDLYSFSFDLLDFLEDWLVQHLNHMDKKYTKCFNDHGLR